MRNWFPLLILASAQFVMVRSSVMNVAISQIVEDLDTTIQACRRRSRCTRWVELDVGDAAADADHRLDQDELLRVAMARQ